MQKPAKILLGIVSILPAVWMAAFIAFMFFMSRLVISNSKSPSAVSSVMPDFSPYIFIGQLLTILLIFGLTAFYIVYLFRTSLVPTDQKALWAVVLFLGNAIAFPIFWYLYVWKARASGAAG